MNRPSENREQQRLKALQEWAHEKGVSLDPLDAGQQWLVFAALQVVTHLGSIAALKRVLGYFLAHSGMGLGTEVIAKIIGVSSRAIRSAQALPPERLLHSVRNPVGGHRQPKLNPEHAGPVAKFLVANPDAKVKQTLAFINKELQVEVDRLTLRRFFKIYGLGCLRGEIIDERPLFSDAPAGEEPSS
jgi:transposase